MTPTLHFMCGKMAAGKSTLARRLAEQHGAILICEDLWLQQLYPTEIEDFEDYIVYARRLKAMLVVLDTDHGRCIEQLEGRNRARPPGSMPMSVEQFEAISALFVPPAEDEGFRIQRHR